MSKAAWQRAEAPLIEVDAILDAFAKSRGLALTHNLKDWPQRSMRWRNGIEYLIQRYLDDEAELTFNLWLCALQDRGAERYWKREMPTRAQRLDQFKDALATILQDSCARIRTWSRDDLEFGARVSCGS